MKPLNILHVGNHTLPCIGGVERVIWESAREQARKGHCVSIMVFSSCTSKNGNLPSLEEKEDVTIHRVPGKGPSFYRIPPIGVLLHHAREKDVIHVHGFGAWLDILALFKFSYAGKLFLTTHGGFYHTPARALVKSIYRFLIIPFSLFPVRTIFCVGEGDKQFVPSYFKSKTVVIPNGIVVSGEKHVGREKTFKKKPFHLLFLGRLSSNKHVEVLIDVIQDLHSLEPRARLHITGEDWEGLRSSLEEKVTKLGLLNTIIFHGKISDAETGKLLNESDAFVSASSYEGFGMTALEAMGAGCIPFLSPIPTFKEFVQKDRGFILDVENPSSAAREIARVLNFSPAKKNAIRARARAYVVDHFSWESVIEKQVNYYTGKAPAARV